jgi:tetratricopeptide (TPR) repeat protein
VAFTAHEALGHVAFQEARYDEAASCYANAVQANPRFRLYYFLQAAALALAGRAEEARPIVGQLLEFNPSVRSSEVFEYALLHRALADKNELRRLGQVLHNARLNHQRSSTLLFIAVASVLGRRRIMSPTK